MSEVPDQTQPHLYSFGERLGVVLIVEAAGISGAAVVGLLLFIAFVSVHNATMRRKGHIPPVHDDSSHIHHYLITLLGFELLQAASGLMGCLWVKHGRIVEGPYCTAQGMLDQAGDIGVALTSMAIGIHTFFILVMRRHARRAISYIVAGSICTFVVLLVVIGHAIYDKPNAPYFGDTGLWCWITAKHPRQRTLEYFWLLFAVFLNSVIYIFLALAIRGFLVIEDGRIAFRIGKKRKLHLLQGTNSKSMEKMAWTLLLYPAVYVITILPLAFARLIAFSHPGTAPSLGATISGRITFQLSGFFNVLLFWWTRPRIIKGDKPPPSFRLSRPEFVSEMKLDERNNYSRFIRKKWYL